MGLKPPAYRAWPLPATFPRSWGTGELGTLKGFAEVYSAPPMSPFDLFAIAAYLMELSGAYHHVAPMPPRKDKEDRRLRQLALQQETAAPPTGFVPPSCSQ